MSLSQNKNALFGNKATTTPSQNAGKSSTASASVAKPPPAPSTTTAAPPVSKTAGMTLKPAPGSSTTSSSLSVEAKRKKMEEAREASEKGMECLKTSFFQWKPDHLSAATHFENSGNLYRVAGEHKNAIAMLLKAAESNEQVGILSAAAINKTKAAEISKESGNQKQCAKLLKEAAETWGIHGDLQKYGETLMKAAKELEDVDTNNAKETYNKGLEVLCPPSTKKEQLNQCHPVLVDIIRNMLTFMIRHKFYQDAIKIANKHADICQAFEIEATMCKSLATVTILYLTLGDVVKAQQVYLQEHLSNSVYMRSKECEFIDELVMACNNQDVDMLDKARMHPQVNYFDVEVQKLIKGISIFGFEESEAAPVVSSESTQKSSLFATKPKAPTPAPPAPAPANIPPPPPPAPVAPPASKVEEDHFDATGLADDLDNIHVEDDHGVNEVEEVDPFTEAYDDKPSYNNYYDDAAPVASNNAAQDEDEDELDLS